MRILLLLITAIFITYFTIVNSQRRIHGGITAEPGKFAHVVFLRTSKSSCTGCIIHKDWILTAAHCVSQGADNVISPNELRITAGTVDIEARSDKVQVRKAKEIVVHEEYYGKLGKPDLSVVRVNASFEFDDWVKKMGFNTDPWPQNDKFVRENCVAAGWGKTEEGRTSILKYLPTTARHGKGTCPCIEKSYILKRYVCLPNKQGEGICFGDSGGVLLCENLIVGVAHVVIDKRSCSYTSKVDKTVNCGNQNVYGVYIYTCPFLDWIAESVPDVPGTPDSCKVCKVRSSSMLMIVLIYLLITFYSKTTL